MTERSGYSRNLLTIAMTELGVNLFGPETWKSGA
jgi:hypothetical protein